MKDVATFSNKGRKNQQDAPAEKAGRITESEQESLSSLKNDSLRQSANSQLMQRDIARSTELKIDAIEAAIANDYLKASVPASPASTKFHLEESDCPYDEEAEPLAANLIDFPPTIFRFDKETFLLLSDDEAE